MKKRDLLKTAVAVLFAGGLAFQSHAAPGDKPLVPIQVAWIYEGLPKGMYVYEAAPGEWQLGKTQVVNRPVDAPIGALARESTLWLRPGERKQFVMVYANDTSQTVYFFAAPHIAEPPAASFGFKFWCLCTNNIYKVPPGKAWYRIGQIELLEKFTGARLRVTHHLVAVEKPL